MTTFTEREKTTLHMLRAQAALTLAYLKVEDPDDRALCGDRLRSTCEQTMLHCDLFLSP